MRMRQYTYLRKPSALSGLRIDKVVAGYCLGSLWLTMVAAQFKYLTYVIPLAVLLAVLANGRLSLPTNGKPYLILIVGAIALAPLGKVTGLQDVYLMLIGLSPLMFGYTYRVTWKQIFWASLVATVALLAIKRAGAGGIEFDPMTSKSSFESTTSFVFGMLAVWAALERRWRAALFALIICILTLKRIVALAALVSVVVLLAPRVITDRLLRPLPMLALNALYLVLVVMYTNGAFDPLIHDLTGQSPNQFGMGRQSRYHYPVEALLADPVRFTFVGIGAGGIYDLMKGGWDFLSKLNLHNDSLKILVEYGGIVWVVFFTTMFWPTQRFEVRLTMLFTNIILLTDNALIYPYVIFALGLMTNHLARSGIDTAVPFPAGPSTRFTSATRPAMTMRP